jgi:ferredoxin-NADP reductase
MADLSPNIWRPAKITDIIVESPRTKTFRFEIDGLYPYVAGQHFSIQLRSPNGYTATRDYSFSSAPSSNVIETTIAHAPHGEVSGWFNETAEIGDRVDISPPIGHYFNWTPAQTEPVLLIAGGVGATPLVSMIREHQLQHSSSPISLFYSVRDFEDICFKSELTTAQDVVFTLTDSQPEDWQGNSGRVTAAMLRPLLQPNQTIYVCGPTSFVEAADTILVAELSVDPMKIKTERFG